MRVMSNLGKAENLSYRYMWAMIRNNDEDGYGLIHELTHMNAKEVNSFMLRLASMISTLFNLLENSDKQQYDIIYDKLSESIFLNYN